MARVATTKVIDGLTVSVRPISPKANLANGMRVGALLAPLIAAGMVDDTERKIEKFREAILSVHGDLDWLVDTFLSDEHAEVIRQRPGSKDKERVPFSVAMEELFTDGETLAKCLWFALEVNYARFFDRMSAAKGLLEGLVAEAKAALETALKPASSSEASPTDSTPSGPSGDSSISTGAA